MEHFDEILLEQYFSNINLDSEMRNNCINLLLHTKDIYDSEYSINDKNSNNYDLLTLHLINNNGVIKFNGAVYNESENRLIEGIIVVRNKKICIDTSVYRLNDSVNYSEKEYSVSDLFRFKDNKIIRRSVYDNGEYFEEEVVLMNKNEVEDYLQRKVENMKGRKL